MNRIWKVIFERRYLAVLLLFFFMAIYAGLSYLTSFLQTDELIINSLSEKLSEKQIDLIVANNHKKGIFKYFISSLYAPFLALTIALVVFVGRFFLSLEISFYDVFKITVVATIVILLQEGVKLLWFNYVNPPKSLIELRDFIPLSLQNIFSFDTLEKWQIALFSVSLFDLLLMLVLASGLKYKLKIISFEKALVIVLSTYGIGLLLFLAIKVSITTIF